MKVRVNKIEEVTLNNKEVKQITVSFLKKHLKLPSESFMKDGKVYVERKEYGHNVDIYHDYLRDATEVDKLVFELESTLAHN